MGAYVYAEVTRMSNPKKPKVLTLDELSGRLDRDEMLRAIKEMEKFGPELEVVECDASEAVTLSDGEFPPESGVVRAYRFTARK